MKKLEDILLKEKIKKDKNNIWKTAIKENKETEDSKKKWEEIYNFSLTKLEADRQDFIESKLKDHLSYIENTYSFTDQTIYLEIGCGPAYIAESLMKKHDCYFIGVDFNYQILESLQKYLKKKNLKKYILIHGDISQMPVKNASIDYVYGGGVIEHFYQPGSILKEVYRILKKGGISFNTIPAFNFSSLMRMQSTIPSAPLIRNISEVLHLKVLKSKLLNKHHGYELSFTRTKLLTIHKEVGFTKSKSGAFAFHPSPKRMKSEVLRKAYFALSKINFLTPIYYIFATK